MATDTTVETKDEFDLVAVFRAAAPETRERRFWITLSVALTIHALILIGIVRSAPKQMGDPNSTPDGLSVSFVTEAELRDASTGADGGPSAPPPQPDPAPAPKPEPPPQPPEPQAQPQQAPAQAQPPAPKPPEPQAEPVQPKAEQLAKAEEATAPETPMLRDTLPADDVPEKKAEETKPAKEISETEAKDVKKPEEKKPVETPQDLAKERPDLLDLPPTTTPAQQPRQKQQPAKPQQKQAMQTQPNLSMPQDSTTTPSYEGRSAGVQRPAGITRSGANDDFARGVIKALRKTMPQMNVLGRVTVKILINLNGNIEKVDVLSRSENTDLNRAIVFSTKQASFPFPPPGATTDDRTFTITYIYH
ncbi:MAG: TonB family protein [Hyphomicrobiaceae bacterium]|nr:TonB family protein [Hyphomicrobiaceae bacterium]